MDACTWPLDLEMCCSATGLDPDDPTDAARIESVIAQATAMLVRWSGFTVGACRTVRPLDPCGECRSGCCASGDCIVLHGASGVTAVRVDGVELDSSLYHFDAGRGTLCAVPPMTWPTADPRHESTPALEVDTLAGSAPDAWAIATATTLACELLQSCVDSKKCRLPRNATSVTTHGVTITLSDDEIRLLLPEVAAWVSAVNPANRTMPPRLFSPEADRAAVVGKSPSMRRAWSR